MKFFKLIFPILLLASCNKLIQSDTERYFEETFNLIKNNSVKKNEIDWNKINIAVRDSIIHLNSNLEVHRAISYTVKLINDGHSIFGFPQNPADTKSSKEQESTDSRISIPPIKASIIENDIGYIKLSGLNIINDSLSKRYTLDIRKTLLELDKSAALSGWVVDLRAHGGGRLSTESLGLSPLFENSLIGIYWNNQNIYNDIICTNKYFKVGNQIQDSLSYDSTILNRNHKIAVLIDDKTASSGEFLAMAFKFQDNSKTFGKPTKGKTSHLGFYELKDGAILLLAQYYYCDINKNIIKKGIIPDLACDSEECLAKATEWIKNSI